ncbi:MAG: helix-turn-helix domain-containing protein [Clostridia bacterium]|nr:helix-turn-helix domain-containing protein [Clostridia bacterium]
MNVSDLQQALGIGRNQAYDLVNRDDFPKIRVGRKILIPRDALIRWLDKQTQQALG